MVRFSCRTSALSYHSRILQFSAYTFDAHILEIFGALIHGACVCVISEEERLNDLVNTINRRLVNWSLLTPTVARLLMPQEIPCLKTMILSGEPLAEQDITRWADSICLFNGLGPSECSILACLTRPLSLGDSPSNIGFPMSCHLWIVDINDPNKLASIGNIGQLVIEGPIIGRGYLNRREATSSAFVSDLKWSRNHSTESRRFYLTGDLAKFNADGSITYVGRGDQQVKIRGQRVELREIETQVCQLLPPGSDALVEYLPVAGVLTEPTLTAFLRIGRADSPSVAQGYTGEPSGEGVSKQGDADFPLKGAVPHNMVADLRQSLRELLPGYMIPAAYVAIGSIPRTPSGKSDRMKLRNYAKTLTREDMHLHDTQMQKSGPTTAMEQELCSIWSQILNLPVAVIGINDSFISLGGDSITAMQVVAEGRKRGIKVTVSTILSGQAINEIALKCEKMIHQSRVPTINSKETSTAAFALSPVQRLYFSKELSKWTKFNQSFLLRLRKLISPQTIRRALDIIVERHHMLRARFILDDTTGIWQQQIAAFDDRCYGFEWHEIQDIFSQIDPCTQRTASTLDIVNGPVFAINMFDAGEGSGIILFMVAHHLVIDLVSWRVIWRDLEELLQTGTISPLRSLSFRNWCKQQESHTVNQATRLEEAFPLSIPSSKYAFWKVSENQNTVRRIVEESFCLDRCASELILGSGNAAFRTTPVDIMLGVLIFSFGQIFTERQSPSIFLEQHGRQIWETDQDLDISETVGWFTTMYPLHIPLEPSTSTNDAVRLVKDLRRRVPDKGRPYFACKHLLPDVAQGFLLHDPIEVLFNFTGSFQQLERPDGFLEHESRLKLSNSESNPGNHRWAMIDISVTVSRSTLKFSFDLHQEMAHLNRVRQWIVQYEKLLVETATQLANQQPQFTPSDFPLLKTSYAELGCLISRLSHSENVHDIFPLTSFQKMLVRGNLEDPPRHLDYLWADIPPMISPKQLWQACRKLVEQFDSLRTIFIECEQEMFQVVLKTLEPSIVMCKTEDNVNTQVQRSCEEDLLRSGPLCLGQSFLRFKIISNQRDTRLILRISHAQYDGLSLGPIMNALSAICQGERVQKSTEFVEYMRLYLQPKASNYAYWRSLLQGSKLTTSSLIKPRGNEGDKGTTRKNSTMPLLNGIPGITAASVFSSACAILLSRMESTTDVVFARFVSGRAGLDAGIQDVVGPCVNIVPVRAQVTDNSKELLASIQRQHVESIAHENLGWDELVQQCTTWPNHGFSDTDKVPVLVQYRNFDVSLKSAVGGSVLGLSGWDQMLVHPFPRSLCLGAFPSKDGVVVSVSSGSGFCTLAEITHIADQLCGILATLIQMRE